MFLVICIFWDERTQLEFFADSSRVLSDAKSETLWLLEYLWCELLSKVVKCIVANIFAPTLVDKK